MKSSFALILLIVIANTSHAQEPPVTYISPGVRIGYNPEMGMVIGAELSLSMWAKGRDGATGAVLSFDLVGKDEWRLNVSYQASLGVGVSLGPTIQKHRDSSLAFGWTASFFIFEYAMPYYSFTGIIKGGYSDYGVLLKMPVAIMGEPIKPKDFFNFPIM
jgi:hypothetical protein